eukprot:s212_g16.t1
MHADDPSRRPKSRKPPRPPSASKSPPGSSAPTSATNTPRNVAHNHIDLPAVSERLVIQTCKANIPAGDWVNGKIRVPLKRATCHALLSFGVWGDDGWPQQQPEPSSTRQPKPSEELVARALEDAEQVKDTGALPERSAWRSRNGRDSRSPPRRPARRSPPRRSSRSPRRRSPPRYRSRSRGRGGDSYRIPPPKHRPEGVSQPAVQITPEMRAASDFTPPSTVCTVSAEVPKSYDTGRKSMVTSLDGANLVLMGSTSTSKDIKEMRDWLHATRDLLPASSTTGVITALSLEPVRPRAWIQREHVSTDPVTNGAELRTGTRTATVAERDSAQSRQ